MLKFILLLLLTTATLSAQGIQFFEGSWAEALEQAAAEDKLIFVDAYAEWCGPCKMMSARVFPDQEVGEYFNANFISVKYDMEKSESEEFRQWHSASAYPTLLFINAENEVVHRLIGARQTKQLLRDAASALARTEKDLDELRADYEADNTAETAYAYVRALLRAEEAHLRVANDYLRRPEVDFTAPATLRLLLLSATEADSRLFDLLLEHREAVAALEGGEAVDAQLQRAVRNTFDKGLEYRSEDLLATAVEKLALINREEAKRLESEGEFALALRGNDYKDFVKASKSYLKHGAAGDAGRLRGAFTEIKGSSFKEYKEATDLAAEALSAAAELSPEEGWRDYYQLARYLQERMRNEQALEAAERSLAGLTNGPANYRRAVQALVDELRAATK
ncbi:Thiol:disulfide interchange protein DsbD [Neolewinella maritima]|uniref:Thiol:disulfide interchange protein DsbD n=1 Tax=Neolewinella maritima TaxID=1383882 RepID=A0ABM9AVN2_9BACT|nr:thioredoxin family protein [Neolewinella maritima]CAH0998691.1 Thiol:disulfide interchange protein DsbD [Neolewinella maritima]